MGFVIDYSYYISLQGQNELKSHLALSAPVLRCSTLKLSVELAFTPKTFTLLNNILDTPNTPHNMALYLEISQYHLSYQSYSLCGFCTIKDLHSLSDNQDLKLFNQAKSSTFRYGVSVKASSLVLTFINGVCGLENEN